MAADFVIQPLNEQDRHSTATGSIIKFNKISIHNENIYGLTSFDEYSGLKYLQLTNSIEKGKIEKDYILLAINDMRYELDIRRYTGGESHCQLR